MRIILIAALLAACSNPAGPIPGFVEAGPGSLQCRRALSDWVTNPAENVNNPNFRAIQAEVLGACVGGKNDGPADTGGFRE